MSDLEPPKADKYDLTPETADANTDGPNVFERFVVKFFRMKPALLIPITLFFLVILAGGTAAVLELLTAWQEHRSFSANVFLFLLNCTSLFIGVPLIALAVKHAATNPKSGLGKVASVLYFISVAALIIIAGIDILLRGFFLLARTDPYEFWLLTTFAVYAGYYGFNRWWANRDTKEH